MTFYIDSPDGRTVQIKDGNGRVVFSTGADGGVDLPALEVAGQSVDGGGGGALAFAGEVAYDQETFEATLESNKFYLTASGGGCVMTLPASPADGDQVLIVGSHDQGNNTLNVGAEGQSISRESGESAASVGDTWIGGGTIWLRYVLADLTWRAIVASGSWGIDPAVPSPTGYADGSVLTHYNTGNSMTWAAPFGILTRGGSKAANFTAARETSYIVTATGTTCTLPTTAEATDGDRIALVLNKDVGGATLTLACPANTIIIGTDGAVGTVGTFTLPAGVVGTLVLQRLVAALDTWMWFPILATGELAATTP